MITDAAKAAGSNQVDVCKTFNDACRSVRKTSSAIIETQCYQVNVS